MSQVARYPREVAMTSSLGGRVGAVEMWDRVTLVALYYKSMERNAARWFRE